MKKMKQTREKMNKGAAFGIVVVMLSAILLASVPSAMGAQFFGDANEDGTIDIKDVTYVKLIIFGKKSPTELADANQDGRINVGDVIQIKLIILRKVPFGRVVIPVSGDFMKGNILIKGMGPTGSIMYEGLVTKNSWEDTYDCWLAESWEISNDAKIYTFHLKKNAKWHDGVSVTSEDVKFTHDYIKSKKLWLSSVLSRVDYVECPDDYTAVFYLKSSYSAFLDKLSHCPGVAIIPKHIWENVDDPDTFEDTEYIGSGPFKFKKRIPGQYTLLEVNKDYHGKMPRVKEVVFKVMPNKDVQILALLKGEIDGVDDIRPAVASSLKGRKNIKVYSAPDTRGYEVGFNVKTYPANITAFRKAMAHAIDRERICNIVFGGHAGCLYNTFLMPSVAHDFVNYDLPEYDYDLAETKRLLKSAGFEDRDDDGILEGPGGEDLTIIMPKRDITQILKEDWEELGIIVDIKQGKWHEGAVFIVGMPYLMHDDPDDLAHFGSKAFFGKANWYDYSNPEYDQLIEEIRSTADREERKEIGYKMQEILATEVPTVSICSADTIFAYRSDAFVGWEWGDVHPLSWWHEDIKVLLNIQPAQW